MDAVPPAHTFEYFHHAAMTTRWTNCHRWLLRCLFGAFAAAFFLPAAAALFVWSRFDGTGTLPADCAIVFGAAVYGSRPSGAVVRRVTEAVELYKAGMIKRVFVTGGKSEGDQHSEADVMRRFALGNGVLPEDITVETQARSTWENLVYTRPLTEDCETVVGISDRYHLARIELLARRQGWGSLGTLPARDLPDPRIEFRSVLREVAGSIYYALFLDAIWNAAPTATLEDAGIIEKPTSD